MAETAKKDNDLVFLGINFNNFFKGCGCFKRVLAEGENESVSSSGDLPLDLAQRYQDCGPAVGDQFHLQVPIPGSFLAHAQNGQPNIEGGGANWLELEDMPLQAENPIIRVIAAESQGEGPSQPIEASAIEDYCTQDPIDFDYLKESIKFQDDDDTHSQASGLSRGSKKINKEAIENDKKKIRSRSANTKEKDPNNIKGRRRAWQPHEDAKVIELVGKYGQSWAVVASMMEGRTGKQIRDRYLNKLKPDIKRADWTPEEDRALLGLYYQIGHKWSKIATYLPGRTEGQVKNRFYSHIKKKLNGFESSENYSGTKSSPMSEVNGSLAPNGREMDIDDGGSNDGQHPQCGRQGGPDSPAMSSMTTSTQETKIQTEDDVDNILEKLTGFMGKKPAMMQPIPDSACDIEKMSIEDKMTYLGQPGPMNNVERLDKFEQLQKRKDKLELLLAQTLRDMGNVNPSSLNGF